MLNLYEIFRTRILIIILLIYIAAAVYCTLSAEQGYALLTASIFGLPIIFVLVMKNLPPPDQR